MAKKYVGKMISVKMASWKDALYGYVVDYNDDWMLLKQNSHDYVMDGYAIISVKHIKGFRRDIDEKFREKIINLKKQGPTGKEKIPLDDLATILNFLTKKFGVFEFYTKSEDVCYLGAAKSVGPRELELDYLDPAAKWAGIRKFKTADIRKIEFQTDYINSLKLVAKKKSIR